MFLPFTLLLKFPLFLVFELDVCDEDIPKRVVYYILPEKREQILKDLKKLGIDNYFLFPELEKDISEVIGEYKC